MALSLPLMAAIQQFQVVALIIISMTCCSWRFSVWNAKGHRCVLQLFWFVPSNSTTWLKYHQLELEAEKGLSAEQPSVATASIGSDTPPKPANATPPQKSTGPVNSGSASPGSKFLLRFQACSSHCKVGV